MNARICRIAAALCLLAPVAGCKNSDSGHSPNPSTPTITITPSTTVVVANGTNTVDLDVTDTGGGPVTVTTARGSFAGGATSATVQGASGRLTLTTCNAANAGCAGTFSVTATSSTGTATASLTFATLAGACASSCSADVGCAGLSCTSATGGAGTCSSTSPSTCLTGTSTCVKSPAGAATETSCSDQVDNDCDGKVDCADTDCDGLGCSATNALAVCKSGTCTDLSSGLALTVTPARIRMPANGTATTTVVVKATSAGSAAPNLAVTLATTLGSFTGGVTTIAGTTGKDGTVSFTFTAPAAPGVARLTATATAAPTVSGAALVTIPRLGSIQIPSPFSTHRVMGVRTSGWNELNGVVVQVLDDEQLPYPDGLAVRFEHRTLGGSTFGPPLATTNLGACTAAAGCVAYDAAISGGPDKPDETGLATVPLFSGTLAGTLDVTATASAGGATAAATLPGIAVVGAKASLANFSIQCAPRNVPALAQHDCGVSWVNAPIKCVALLKDRFDNLLGTRTQVIFASEASAVGQVTNTPAFDPTQTGDKQPDLGSATQIFETLGAGLPFDVPPQAGEPSVSHGLDGCGTRTHNPRDGVVTIVAIADGEEAFFDSNGNGQYDAGEPFIDQGEPFVDQNDNAVYDAGEWFLDVDGDHAYTPANGQWDAQAKIWTQTVVVYTTAGATMAAAGGTTFLGNRWVDNGPAPRPFSFTGACNPTPAPTPFALTAANPVANYAVVAADQNLNFLSTATTYAVEAVGTVNLKFTYRGLPEIADLLGFSYQYWPCDQNGVCASQCRATGAAAPCEMTPAISGFSCGYATGVSLTRGSTPDTGTVELDWNVVTPWDRYQTAEKRIVTVPLFGTSL